MAKQAGSSLAKSCGGDQAALLGSYRLMRNGAVKPEAVRASGFARAAELAQSPELLLAVEDTTSVSYPHAVAAGLGLTGGKQTVKRNGLMVHSVLLLDAQSECTVGLIAQHHWCRDPASHGKNHTRRQRTYQDRESYKWERASVDTAQCLGPAMQRTISVCDRESDIYDYLWHKRRNNQRLVVRAQANRRLVDSQAKLFDTLQRDAVALCGHTVHIPQRGGRKARTANVLLRTATLDVLAPAGSSADGESLRINAVLAEEADAPAASRPLHWVLLTTEAVNGAQAALQVVRHYELRWRIEDHHKGVEGWHWRGAATLPKYRELGTDAGDHRVPGRAPAATAGAAGQARQYGRNDLREGVGRRRMESPVGFDRTRQALAQHAAVGALGILCSGKTGRVQRHQAHRACRLGHNLARLVSVTRTASGLPTQQIETR
jgi:hypothetical protein